MSQYLDVGFLIFPILGLNIAELKLETINNDAPRCSWMASGAVVATKILRRIQN